MYGWLVWTNLDGLAPPLGDYTTADFYGPFAPVDTNPDTFPPVTYTNLNIAGLNIVIPNGNYFCFGYMNTSAGGTTGFNGVNTWTWDVASWEFDHQNSETAILQVKANFSEPTPTPADTSTPTTPTPALPTATPTPQCNSFGCSIEMPSNNFGARDACWCKVTICNPSAASYANTPVFAILDIHGAYFFAPEFNNFSHYTYDIIPGLQTIDVLSAFQWPSNVGSDSGIFWHAAMTDQAITQLFGMLDTFTFGWH
jgi:hypothetical protein